jgi:ribosomal protein L16 Arg81 hydroxylase
VHRDDQDGLIVQIAGSKSWEVRRPVSRGLDPFDDPPPGLHWKGVLSAGDMLYLPRGWWHEAQMVGGSGPSLQVSIRIDTPTGLDLLDWLFHDLNHLEVVRADLPRLGTADEQARRRDELRDAVLARITPELVQRFLADATPPSLGPRPRWLVS